MSDATKLEWLADPGSGCAAAFQTVRLAPPGLHPAHFLCSSLSTETRR